MKNQHLSKGFTLLELSIVLIIVSVVIGMGIRVGMAQIENTKISKTREMLSALQVAITNYVITNNSLPCPAPINAATGTTNMGAETDCTIAAVAGVTNVNSGANNLRIGAIPTRALGLPDSMEFDAWGRRMTYVVDKAVAHNVGTIAVTGTINITDANGNSLTTPASTGSYFLFSSGSDGKGAYNKDGSGPTNACGTNKDAENCDGDFQFIDSSYNNGTTTNYYDDLVIWKTSSMLTTDISGAN